MNKFFSLAGIALAGAISSSAAADRPSTWPGHFAAEACSGMAARLKLVAELQELVGEAVAARLEGREMVFREAPMDPGYFLEERPTFAPPYAYAGMREPEAERREFVGATNALAVAKADALAHREEALRRRQERAAVSDDKANARGVDRSREKFEKIVDRCIRTPPETAADTGNDPMADAETTRQWIRETWEATLELEGIAYQRSLAREKRREEAKAKRENEQREWEGSKE